MRAFTLGLLVSTGIAYAAYRRGSLSASGALAAVGVGAVVMGLGGVAPGVALLGFFLTGTALSHYRHREKQALVGDKVEKGERRDAVQVLANGGPAAAFCLLWAVTGWEALWVAALGSLAAAAADTWATEIGVLSEEPPRMLLTWQPAEAGTSGAVSTRGLVGMMAGALFVGGLAAVFGAGAGERGLRLLLVVAAAGVNGAIVDSLLGATVQEQRACLHCGAATEQERHRCGGTTIHTGGIKGMDNDAVNALSTIAGGLWAAVLWRMMG